ncbi:hypothetical protein GO495_13080 [Chitinophaga oryziterrae]|uniref:DUF4595 domain-containing protein n=1 Tax=Chitinophaga oryziterrae TaxID=1031224 RepID=A0A6N8J8F3_9BACT|nr:hypothetical protein [Chitinophaga oryziterrae]MVT41520.1 hypothetical protein [Chitinophaga oryziterrae]
MKQFSLIVLCAVTYILSGCNKYPDCSPGVPSCQIVKIIQGFSVSVPEDTLTFAYNNKGNPVSITRTYVGTSSPNFLFIYDKKNRMTDFYGVYTSPNPYFDIWHRYHYDAKNRIISDTTYEFGFVGPGIPLPDQTNNGQLRVRNVSTYGYDLKDRIVKSTDTYGFPESDITTRFYTYNRDGNLVKIVTTRSGVTNTETYSFDDKINLRSTHPIWQFLDRDYSVNNSLHATAFNQYGLPTAIDFSNHGYGQFATILLTDIKISYNCR